MIRVRVCRPCGALHGGHFACERVDCQRWLREATAALAQGREPPPEFDWAVERAKLHGITLTAPKLAPKRKDQRA